MLTLEQCKVISSTFSILSTASWVMAQLPQQIDNYRTKSANGLSGLFLLLWVTGDTLNLISCVLTDQLPFQIYLSCYFLVNDIILDLQYYYYTRPNSEKPAATAYGSVNTRSSANTRSPMSMSPKAVAATVLATAHHATAATITLATTAKPITTTIDISPQTLGYISAWLCTLIYTLSRLPQLYRNYQRHSVEGISPLLFTFALIGNITYTLSLLTSSRMVFAVNRWDYFCEELPYIIGSAGTIVFDLFYFYQRWLYGKPPSYILIDEYGTIE